jgi:endonuclease YncB( thermonuclease family)
LAGLGLVAAAISAGCSPKAPAGPTWYVVSVHDGETVRALDPEKVEHRVRLAGIDAPEMGQAFGRVARDRLRELALRRQVVVQVQGRDRYARDIATLEAGGRDLARVLVAEGLAWHFTRYSDDPALAAAEAEARAAGRGLWADPEPVAPWEWRAGEAKRKASAVP